MKKKPRQSANVVDERDAVPGRAFAKRYLQRNLPAISEPDVQQGVEYDIDASQDMARSSRYWKGKFTPPKGRKL
jgi:hypothetical protein